MQQECWALSDLGTCPRRHTQAASPLQTGKAAAERPRGDGNSSSSTAKREACWHRKSARITSCGSPSSHPAAAHPSSPATTHRGQAELWQLSLLVIIPWEQTCFLFQGRPRERARGERRGEAGVKQHWREVGFPDDDLRIPAQDISIDTWWHLFQSR